MEWLPSCLTLIILALFIMLLVIVVRKACQKGSHTSHSRRKNTLNSLLAMFTFKQCAYEPENNSGSQIKCVEQFFSANINQEFTERRCDFDD